MYCQGRGSGRAQPDRSVRRGAPWRSFWAFLTRGLYGVSLDCIPVARGPVAAIGNSTTVGEAVPTAAAIHAVRDLIHGAIPVMAPHPNITAHVIRSQFVVPLCADLVAVSATVQVIPRNVPDRIAPAVFRVVAFLPASCGVFPLGFARQTIAVCAAAQCPVAQVGRRRTRPIRLLSPPSIRPAARHARWIPADRRQGKEAPLMSAATTSRRQTEYAHES